MLVVGLTGNPKVGKSAVLKLLKAKGARVFNADSRVHAYYRKRKGLVYKKIAREFPEVLSSGRICRQKLASLVFAEPERLRKLEQIVHPVIIGDLKQWIKQCRSRRKGQLCVAEVPLLFEKKLQVCFDCTVLVKGPFRLSKRSMLKEAMNFYQPLGRKIKRVDFVVKNNKNIKSLTKEVDLLWKNLKEK